MDMRICNFWRGAISLTLVALIFLHSDFVLHGPMKATRQLTAGHRKEDSASGHFRWAMMAVLLSVLV